jgi:flagella basal body P-ring formation protein FlgA
MRGVLSIAAVLVTGLWSGAAFAQAVAPVRAIRAQNIIVQTDLTMLEDSVPGAITSMSDVLGREAKVTLYAGRPIRFDQIGAPALIDRNQIVPMKFGTGLLSIRTEGRALDRAGIGERVRVMNLSSRQVVVGVVTADGSIEVGQ